MRPVRKPWTNFIWSGEGDIMDLPACRDDGVTYTYWRPTWKDRLLILFGRDIRLAVAGSWHPPVMIDTEQR